MFILPTIAKYHKSLKKEQKKDLSFYYETEYTQKIQQSLGQYYLVMQNGDKDIKLIYIRDQYRQVAIISSEQISLSKIAIIKLTAKLMEKEYEKKIGVCK